MNREKLTKSIIWLALITGAVLLMPLIAMQFTTEVNWTLSDFIVMGFLIFGTGITYLLITKKSADLMFRIAVAATCATGFLLIWMNLAVGIIGSESNPINLLFYGVTIIGLTGSVISRFQPKGMVFVLITTALAQALISAIILVGGYYHSTSNSIAEIVGINGFFIMLWIFSALLFWYSSGNRDQRNVGGAGLSKS